MNLHIKNRYILLVFSILISITISCKHNQIPPNRTTETSRILDSLEVLVNIGGFFDGHAHPPTKDEERYMNLSYEIRKLPFEEVVLLLNDKNPIKKAHAFAIAATAYYEKLQDEHLQIFLDDDNLLFYSRGGPVDKKITVGQFAKMVYESEKELRKFSKMQPKVEDEIKKFINVYSKYSASYEPLDFNYLYVEELYNGKAYFIEHKYNLKTLDQRDTLVYDFFTLDNNFVPNSILSNPASVMLYNPPKIEEWLLRFGRELSKDDSTKLKLNKN